MKRFLKWFLIVGAAGVALLASTVLLIPLFFDAEDFKPRIQSMISDAAGRPVALTGEIGLSVFPWTGFSIGGFEMMNPPGFSESHFLTVESFDIKVALVPLFSRDIQVRHIRLESPRIVLETNEEGRSNWEGLGRSSGAPPEAETGPAPSDGGGGLPVGAFRVDEIALSDGQVLWIDRAAGVRKTVSDVRLKLEDISPDTPVQLTFSAAVDGDPVSLKGNVGPVGTPPGASPLNLDLTASALDLLTVHLKGKVETTTTAPSLQASVDVAPFSPKKLAGRLGQSMETSDPKALEKVAFKGDIVATPSSATLSDGRLTLDDSTLDLSLAVGRFDRPDVRFDLRLDAIDADRYLPPGSAEAAETGSSPSPAPASPNREALRRLLLSGNVQVGQLTVSGGTLRDIRMTLSAKDGVFTVDPLDLALYSGTLHGTAAADLSGAAPESRVHATFDKVDAGPLLTDFAGKDVITGTGKGDLRLRAVGDTPAAVKRRLNGKGELVFTDGAVKGVDLTRIVRNAKTLLTLKKQPPLEGRTDFSEFKSAFTIDDGVVAVSEARLTAPLMRFSGGGKADLTAETLDFRAEPKLVATLEGKGDETRRSGFTVPLLITGTFDAPKIRPDPEALLRQVKNLPESLDKGKAELERGLEEKKAAAKKLLEEKKDQLDSLLGGQKSDGEDSRKPSSKTEEKASDLLKKLPFGQ